MSTSVKAQALMALAVAFVRMTGARSLSAAPAPSTSGTATSDVDILNFALNLEYLEAEFYSCAAFGSPLASSLRSGGPASTGCQKASLSPIAQQLATELANNEIGHVTLLREALGSKAVQLPQIDIGSAFSDALTAALGSPVSPPFSPYANDIFFLLGAFIFEDVGVTAYEGAAGQISNVSYLETAAKIVAVEAYQAGIIRSFLYQANGQANSDWPYQPTIASVVQSISDLRDSADGSTDDDQGIQTATALTLIPTDSQALVFGRTPSQVIDIVTLGKGPAGGGFLPNGLNGDVNLSSEATTLASSTG